jgi:aldehyde:ferredoxin oxidoreductase
MTTGGHRGERVDPGFYNGILDAYYRFQGWTEGGIVSPSRLSELGALP